MKEEALVPVDSNRLTPVKVAEIIEQVALIQELMASVMKENEHYGVIPGTKKPTLLKPGAEKLGLTFRLAPQFLVEVISLNERGHRDYRVCCTLKSIKTGLEWAQGVGSCSTMESKYRYRHAEPEDTGRPIPGEYWQVRKTSMDKAQDLIGGKGFMPRKLDGQWRIVKMAEEKVENPDIADVYNTVLKMAKKRAHVDAILTATAASDIFTQDVEDLVPVGATVKDAETEPIPEKTAKVESPAAPTGQVKDGNAEASTPVDAKTAPTPAGDVSFGHDLSPEGAKEIRLPTVDSWRDLYEAVKIKAEFTDLEMKLAEIWDKYANEEKVAMKMFRDRKKSELAASKQGQLV